MHQPSFSHRLQTALGSARHPTRLQGLVEAFGDKAFYVLFVVLMAVPALPLPTGGVTHVFELMTMLLALELVAGRRTLWLPQKWLQRQLPKQLYARTLPRFLQLLRRIETLSRRRWQYLFGVPLTRRILGLLVITFAMFAFVAPPFSGLDTLPALGVVLLSLAVIFEDALLALAAVLVGSAGAVLTIALGKAVLSLF